MTLAEIEYHYLELEQWRPVPGYPCCSVSSFGQIRGTSGRMLKLSPHHNEYLRVKVYCAGKRSPWIRVHRLVATVFIPNPFNLPEVHHKDHDITNNRLSNLEWCDRQTNIDYRYADNREEVSGHGPSYYA